MTKTIIETLVNKPGACENNKEDRLVNIISEILPKEKDNILQIKKNGVIDPQRTKDATFGFETGIHEVIQLLPKIIQAVREDTLKEIVELIKDEYPWYNTNNQIPDTELDKDDAHWEMIRKVVRDSLEEFSNRIIKLLTNKE